LKGSRTAGKSNALFMEKVSITEEQSCLWRQPAKLSVNSSHCRVEIGWADKIEKLSKFSWELRLHK